jgi:hypothetical protein
MKEEEVRLLENQTGPRSATKPGRQKISPFSSAAPGRRLPAIVAPLPACPRTAALRLALCPSLSRVSSFTFVLQRAHLPAFHSHFLTAHNTSTVFLNFSFESHFLLSFSLTQYKHCVSQKKSLNHIFFRSF